MSKIIELKIRRAILKQNPFCLVDLYNTLAEEGIYDRNIIESVLTTMCKEGLVTYERIYPRFSNNFGFAFVPNTEDNQKFKIKRAREF